MQKRLDAPAANLRELDRGRITKTIGVEPRINPVPTEIVFKRQAAAEAEALGKLAKSELPDLTVILPPARACATSNRPTRGTVPGQQCFDLSLNRPVWRNASNTGWVDALGKVV
jgi:hypothetical protein